MNKLINTSILIFTLLLLIFMFLFPIETSTNITNILSIWIKSVVPSLFPVLIVTTFIVKTRHAETIGKCLHKPMKLLFNSENSETSFIIFASLLGGTPGNVKLINDSLDKNNISKNYANYLINYLSFMNPLFIITAVGVNVLSNTKIGYLLLLSCVLPNVILAIINKPKSNQRRLNKYCNLDTSDAINSSLDGTIKVLVNILGFMLLFSLIINMLDIFNILKPDFISILEISSGLNKVMLFKSYRFIVCFIAAMLNFFSFSIHMQVMKLSILRIDYKVYLYNRLTLSVLSFATSYIILK